MISHSISTKKSNIWFRENVGFHSGLSVPHSPRVTSPFTQLTHSWHLTQHCNLIMSQEASVFTKYRSVDSTAKAQVWGARQNGAACEKTLVLSFLWKTWAECESSNLRDTIHCDHHMGSFLVICQCVLLIWEGQLIRSDKLPTQSWCTVGKASCEPLR